MKRRLKKALGQHFLKRSETCAPLVAFLEPHGRRVLEVGPGSGTLTRALLAAGARVTAWELDAAWAREVAEEFASEALTVVVGDATEIAWDRLGHGALVTGNLPYNIATSIVLACLESTVGRTGSIERAGFLLQREVAQRLAAGEGDPDYGSLSVLVGALAEVERLGDVPPRAFTPPPRVESAFVGLTPRAVISAEEYAEFKPLVRAAFALRRKTLRNSLAAELGSATAARLVEAAGLPVDTRAERMGVAQFRALLVTLRELRSSV